MQTAALYNYTSRQLLVQRFEGMPCMAPKLCAGKIQIGIQVRVSSGQIQGQIQGETDIGVPIGVPGAIFQLYVTTDY